MLKLHFMIFFFCAAAFSSEPCRTVPVDISRTVNMGFRDDTAGDGKGGWTDQGPKNDMRSFPVEKRKFANIGFEVTDPAENGGKASLTVNAVKDERRLTAEVALGQEGVTM